MALITKYEKKNNSKNLRIKFLEQRRSGKIRDKQ